MEKRDEARGATMRRSEHELARVTQENERKTQESSIITSAEHAEGDRGNTE